MKYLNNEMHISIMKCKMTHLIFIEFNKMSYKEAKVISRQLENNFRQFLESQYCEDPIFQAAQITLLNTSEESDMGQPYLNPYFHISRDEWHSLKTI